MLFQLPVFSAPGVNSPKLLSHSTPAHSMDSTSAFCLWASLPLRKEFTGWSQNAPPEHLCSDFHLAPSDSVHLSPSLIRHLMTLFFIFSSVSSHFNVSCLRMAKFSVDLESEHPSCHIPQIRGFQPAGVKVGASQRTCEDVWRHFWLSQLGEAVLLLVSNEQRPRMLLNIL